MIIILKNLKLDHQKMLNFLLLLDTVEANEQLGFPADLRNYGVGAQILTDLGIKKLKLLTNNPRKIAGLGGYGIEVIERVPLVICPNDNNAEYLSVKKTRKLTKIHCW